MKKTTKRLREEELVNEMQPAVPAQPAAPAEVAAAADPAVATPMEPAVEEPAVAEDPSSNLIPIYIAKDSLENVVAEVMATGDLEGLTVEEEELDTVAEPEAPAAPAAAPAPAAPVTDEAILESISREELDVIREYRKYKAMQESDVNPLDTLSSSEAPLEAVEDVMADILHEAEESADEVTEESADEVTEDMLPEDFEDDELEALADYEDIDLEDDEDEDLVAKINDFLDSFDSYDGASDIPEVLRDVADLIDDVTDQEEDDEDVADVEAIFDEEDEEVEDEDLEMDAEDEEDADLEGIFDEEDEDTFEEAVRRHNLRRVRCNVSRKNSLKEEVIYPAGSHPARTSEDWPAPGSNIVESYKQTQERRREALRAYRENTHRTPSSKRFSEALSSSASMKESVVTDSKSWAANRFFDKYQESKDFSFNDLLKNGFLG